MKEPSEHAIHDIQRCMTAISNALNNVKEHDTLKLSCVSVKVTAEKNILFGGFPINGCPLAVYSQKTTTLYLHPTFFMLPSCLQFRILVHECVSRAGCKLEGDAARGNTAQFLDDMGGYFDLENREYVIVTPHTPAPWINYLGVEGTLSGLISQTGGGSVWFEDPRKYRLLRYSQIGSSENMPGRYLYVRDNVTRTLFSPTCDPIPDTHPDAFECRHGLGYTRIQSVFGCLSFDLLFFIPKGTLHPVEIQSVSVRNLSPDDRDLSFFSYREFVNGDVLDEYVRTAIRNYTVRVSVDASKGVIYNLSGRTMNNPDKPIYYFAATESLSGYDTDYKRFFGNSRLSAPQAVRDGQCTNSHCHANTALGVHQINAVVPGGKGKEFALLLGVIRQPISNTEDIDPSEETTRAVNTLRDGWEKDPHMKSEQAVHDIRDHFCKMIDNFQCSLPTEASAMELMVNTWNGYGVWLNYLHSRSLSDHFSGISRPFLGTRDSASDLLGLVQLSPGATRKRILEWCRTAQLQSGGCCHHYNPRTGETDGQKGFSDDPLWIGLGVSSYIKETGDFSILEEAVRYTDCPVTVESVFAHMMRSIRFSMEHLGPHGIPLMMVSDWNHVFMSFYESNSAEAEAREKSESLMVGMMLVRMAKDMRAMVKAYGAIDPDAENRYRQELDLLNTVIVQITQAINQSAWFDAAPDEGWYARGTDSNGEFFGVPANTEGRIFLLPQAWALFADIADEGQKKKMLNAIKRRLFNETSGLLLFTPSYTKPPPLGSFSIYAAGSRENGATFCQAHAMALPGLAMTRDADFTYRAYETLLPPAAMRKLGPKGYCGPAYGYSQFRYGPDHPLFGQARGSLLTGTVAWSYYSACQWILGIRPDYEGLRIDPCIPSDWPGFFVERNYRGAVYRIYVARDPEKAGQVEVDGKPHGGQLIRAFKDGIHTVKVFLSPCSTGQAYADAAGTV